MRNYENYDHNSSSPPVSYDFLRLAIGWGTQIWVFRGVATRLTSQAVAQPWHVAVPSFLFPAVQYTSMLQTRGSFAHNRNSKALEQWFHAEMRQMQRAEASYLSHGAGDAEFSGEAAAVWLGLGVLG